MSGASRRETAGRARDGRNEDSGGRQLALDRRAFVGLGGQALILVALGGFVRLAGGRQDFLRPPGALPPGEFLSRCIRCQKCLEVCPTGAITPVLLTEAALGAGTPRLDFARGYCDLCMKCVAVCPTGALAPIEKDAVRLGVAQVDRQNCVAWVWDACTRCLNACPSQAIVLDDRQRPVVDADRCTGCGKCEHACISTVVRSYRSTRGKGIVVWPLAK